MPSAPIYRCTSALCAMKTTLGHFGWSTMLSSWSGVICLAVALENMNPPPHLHNIPFSRDSFSTRGLLCPSQVVSLHPFQGHPCPHSKHCSLAQHGTLRINEGFFNPTFVHCLICCCLVRHYVFNSN